MLIVAACGIILYRDKFIGGEGVSELFQNLKTCFQGAPISPAAIYYDKGCELAKYLTIILDQMKIGHIGYCRIRIF